MNKPSQGRDFRLFDAGHNGRRLRAIPTNTEAINATIRKYGGNVLARSRYLCANNSYAASAKEAFASSLVGIGIKPASLNPDAAKKAGIQLTWYDWTDEADADWLTDLYGLQDLVAKELFEAGECFIRIRPRRPEDGLAVPMQLQLLPAEMLPYNTFNTTSDRRVECGIEFDAIGRRVNYHFLRNHPGDLYRWQPSASETVVVPASEVLHIYSPMRAGQIRGVPHSLSGIAPLALMDLYDDAELERKRVAALYAGFVIRNGNDHPLEGLNGDLDVDDEGAFPGSLWYPEVPRNAVGMEPGAMVDLDPGEDIKFSQPADVGGNYEAFQYRNLLRIAAGFGTTYADMTGDLRQTSYASLRAGLVQYRRRIKRMQHHVIAYQMMRPIWNYWFERAVINRAIPVSIGEFYANHRNERRVKWVPPKWDWIDPEKDRKAEEIAVKNGWKSRDDVIEDEGYDPEETDARILASQERAERLGIKIGSGSTSLGQASDPEGFELEDPTEEGEIPND